MNLRQLLHLIVKNANHGYDDVLEAINFGRKKNKMSMQVLINKLNHNYEAANTNTDDVEIIGDTINGANRAIAEYFSAKANGVFVQMPSVDESDMGILDEFMAIPVELGDVCSKFQRAYADGFIDEVEFNQISKEVDDVVSALLKFKTTVGRVVR